MGSVAITFGTAVAGVVLALGAAFALTSAASSTPEPVSQPTVVYGER